jgi:hypothetical protein
MSATPHTPGPFIYRKSEDGCDNYWDIVSVHEPHRRLASILFWDDDPQWTTQTEADARLFAAAPELLGALGALVEARLNRDKDALDVAAAQAIAVLAKLDVGAARRLFGEMPA